MVLIRLDNSHRYAAHLSSYQVNLSPDPQTNGQTERLNQELETTLHCVINYNPASRSTHLLWVKYSHNYYVSASIGLSPFEVSLGYQPLLFPAKEAKLAVPDPTLGPLSLLQSNTPVADSG